MKILYFVKGVPTEAERALAKKTGAVFRNRNAWHDGDYVEVCDQVMGDIPPSYEDVPRVEINDTPATAKTEHAPKPPGEVKRGRGRPRKTPEVTVESQEESAADEPS